MISRWKRWDVGGWKNRSLAWPLYALGIIAALTVLLWPAHAQNGSPHGISASWTPPSPVGGSGVIQGYNLFRCVGSCTVNSTGWVATGGMIPASQTTFLDPASGLNVNTTYTYAVETVDSNGNFSAWSTLATVVVGASFPSNPNPATGFSVRVQ